jgi:very-short-patch-repair endonuclease
MRRAGALVRLVGAKKGVVTSSDLWKAGFTQNEVSAALRTGVLKKVRRGLFVLAGKPLTWEQRLLVATRATEPYGAVAGVSAATLLRLDGFTARPVQVIIPLNRECELEGVTILRSRDFDPAVDRKSVCGLPVTKVPRTLLDLLPHCTETELTIAIEGLIRDYRGLLHGAISYLRERARGRRDVFHLIELITERLHRPATDDAWEVRAELLLKRANLHPSRQVEIRRANGELVARPDIVFRDHRLVVEVDGHATHGTPRAQKADLQREARLNAEGHEVFRTTPFELKHDPEGFITRLRARLAARSVAPVPPMDPNPEQLRLEVP